MSRTMPIPNGVTPSIRRATPADAEACGRICYDAFATINRAHNFPPDIPSAEVAIGMLAMLFAHPGFYGVVAEVDGRIAGSNCLDERSPLAGIGPVTVDPALQNSGTGRALMQAVLDRATARGRPGVRLLQSAFHNRSLALYIRLGFETREPMSVLQGAALGVTVDGRSVRLAVAADLDACNLVCARVHGHNRNGEVQEAIANGSATVVESSGAVTGYATTLGFLGHAVGLSNEDVQALIGAAPQFGGPGIIVPTRNGALLRWCLAHGLRIMQPMTLMTMGLYNEPAGAYLPSVLY